MDGLSLSINDLVLGPSMLKAFAWDGVFSSWGLWACRGPFQGTYPMGLVFSSRLGLLHWNAPVARIPL